MKVTIVDSEAAVVALLDGLDHLPTQPPSLYLDLEGLRLSRHGSISIIQLFVLPEDHIFLVDVYVLKEAAFCISNRSGTNLRSMLESTQVPKVFFDVRNDSDALFAHFRISLGGVYDIQLLEVATRSYSKDRVAGLSKCIEKDAQLTPEASAVWKATKQNGLLRFAPELGGSYEVFNSRPMLQDIVDYCTQDVVYLPGLWEIYTQKISAKWMRKVQDKTCERILDSQKASYEPHSRNKTFSPWANPAKVERGDRPGTNEAKAPGRKAATAVAQTAATEAAKKTAATLPDVKPQSGPSVGQGDLRRSARLANLEAVKRTPKVTAEPERPRSTLDLPIRSRNELDVGPNKRLPLNLHPPTVYSKWRCVTCNREMQEDQKEDHTAGKAHIARAKRTAIPQGDTAKDKPLPATTVTTKTPPIRTFSTKANPRQTVPKPAQLPITTKKKQAGVPKSQQKGQPYPPDHLVLGFKQRPLHRSLRNDTSFSVFAQANEDYSVCDKDCGWCGHCMDGVDV